MIDIVVGHDSFSQKIAEKISKPFVNLEEKIFPNFEIKSVITEPEKIIGKNILLIIRMKSGKEFNADRCFVDTLITVSNLKTLGADQIYLCWPFLPYAKQDKVFLPGEPQSLEILFNILQKAGVDSLLTIMGHPWKTEGEVEYSDLKIKNIFGTKVLAEFIKKNYSLENAVIVSPDLTAGARATELIVLLGLENKSIEKERDLHTGEVKAKNTLDVTGKDVFIIDDFISSGGTVFKAAEMCKDAKSIKVIVMHGVFADNFLEKAKFGVVCSNSFDTPVSKIDITDLLAEQLINMLNP